MNTKTQIDRWIGETGKHIVAVIQEGEPELWKAFDTQTEADAFASRKEGN